MAADIANPIFQEETKAREWLEARIWPNGANCPHCGSVTVTKMRGKAHRPGLYQCNDCREQFTVTVGTVFERSKVPLNKWLLAVYLLSASKKGMSAHQLHRMLGVTYKTAWSMAHRIREAMREGTIPGGMGGQNKVVEVDETYVDGKAKNRATKPAPKKEAVVALVERDGRVRSFHVANVTAKNVREVLTAQVSRKSWLMSDESGVYIGVGREFAGHASVNHSIDQYVRKGGFVHTNTIENVFSLMKRGIVGTYHHVSPAHLKRYLGEFDFRYNNRTALDVSDMERTEKAAKGIVGKRLTYRRINEAHHA